MYVISSAVKQCNTKLTSLLPARNTLHGLKQPHNPSSMVWLLLLLETVFVCLLIFCEETVQNGVLPSPSQSSLSWLVINCMQHFRVLNDASESTLRHWGNIYKLYRLNIFLREGHHFVLYVLNGKATLWHNLHKLYSFLTVNQQTNKCCFQKQHQPNHAWGSVWLFYDLQCISGRQQ